MNPETIVADILASPVATYAALFLLAIVVLFLLAGVVRFILRIFFRSVKFMICIIVALLLLSFLTGRLATDPFIRDSGNSGVVIKAANEFKGFYTSRLPLLAWRFENTTAETLESNAKTNSRSTNSPILVKVEYLPFGEIVLQYDTSTGQFSVYQGLDEGPNGTLFKNYFGDEKTASPLM